VCAAANAIIVVISRAKMIIKLTFSPSIFHLLTLTPSLPEIYVLPLFPVELTLPVDDDDDSTFLLDAIKTNNNVSIKCDNMFA